MKNGGLLIVIVVVLSACSSSPENAVAPNAANSPSAATNAPNANTLAATNANPAAPQPYNGIQNLNPNAFNTTNDNLKVVKYVPKKDELPYGSRTAPDDSVISSGSRGADFIETRTFKNHSVINKVEKIMDGKTTKYKVYLKNGKVFDAPAEKLNNMEAIAPDNILEAIGLSPNPQSDQPAKTGSKKDQKP